MAGALRGMSVLDVSHYIAGPYATKLLADYGADVIKIERPGLGDPARRLGPFPNDEPQLERSGLFLYLNTNKKSVTLDLKTATGKAIFCDLISRADVLVENFHPRVMPALGLAYEVLREINPRLVMTSISNFGQTGPWRDWRSHDLTLLAAGGILHITGDPGREPLKMAGNQASFQAALHAAVATMMGLHGRRVTGNGQHVDISIAECVGSCLAETFAVYTHEGRISKRSGPRQAGRHPNALMPCKDGYVALVVTREDHYEALVKMTGLAELSEPRFATSELRRKNADEFDVILSRYIAIRSKRELLEEFQAYKIPFGIVMSPRELLDDPHYKARSFFVTIDHPATGPLSYPSWPFKWSETPGVSGRAPLLGEQNETVLCGMLGLAKSDLVKLRQVGVI